MKASFTCMQEAKPIDWARYEKEIEPELLNDFKKSFEGVGCV